MNMNRDNEERIEILIQAGDEYRAKIDNDISQNGFFKDVYRTANHLVNEIMTETEKFHQLDGYEKWLNPLKGIDNNIILFTGGRGVGKTSAMHSFSHFLINGLNEEASEQAIFGSEPSCYKKGRFIVLDSIDPSLMSYHQSIVRVLLSKMFFTVEKKLKKNVDPYGNFNQMNPRGPHNEIELKREKIIYLYRQFETCYKHIQYLNRAEMKPEQVDFSSLEDMAELGNSSYLLRQLKMLVDLYLNLGSSDEYSEREGDKYLVVQIDDADLSGRNVFEICEELRAYLKLPNVIILMAANLQQMHQAILEEDLGKYPALANTKKIPDFLETHSRQSWRYIEKVFPPGCRIDIPHLKDELEHHGEEFELKYLQYSQKEKKWREPFSLSTDYEWLESYRTDLDDQKKGRCDETSGKRDLQSQLLCILYDKTGIVLPKSDEYNLLLPSTMRELTHFIRQFRDAETIIHKSLIRAWIGEIPDAEKKTALHEAEELYKNIQKLKQYFLEDWCGTHLYPAEKNLIEEFIDNKWDINRSVIAVRRSVAAKETNGNLEWKHSDLDFWNMVFCYEENARMSAAIKMTYSILANENYASSLKDKIKSEIDNAHSDISYGKKVRLSKITKLLRSPWTIKGENIMKFVKPRNITSGFDEVVFRRSWRNGEEEIEYFDVWNLLLFFWNTGSDIKSLIKKSKIKIDDMTELVLVIKTITTNMEIMEEIRRYSRNFPPNTNFINSKGGIHKYTYRVLKQFKTVMYDNMGYLNILKGSRDNDLLSRIWNTLKEGSNVFSEYEIELVEYNTDDTKETKN